VSGSGIVDGGADDGEGGGVGDCGGVGGCGIVEDCDAGDPGAE
jgi:hypothetical protein